MISLRYRIKANLKKHILKEKITVFFFFIEENTSDKNKIK